MHQEYRSLAAFVRRTQRGMHARRLVQAGIFLLSLLLILLLLGAGIRQLVPFIPFMALCYSALVCLVLLVGGYVLLPALRSISQRQALTAIEQTYPDLHDDLTNALELDPMSLERANPRGIALDLVRALHYHTAQQLRHCSAKAVVRRYRLQGVLCCSLFLLATGFLAVIQPHLLGEAWRMLVMPVSYLPARDMHIAINPAQVTIARGTNLAIQAHSSGRLPRTMDILVQRQGQGDKRYAMESLGQGAFRYVFLKPQTSFAFQARADGAASLQGNVEVVPSPAVGNLTLHYLFPDYTGLSSRTQTGGGDIRALPGTQVQLTMRTNVPVRQGMLHFDHGGKFPLAITGQTLQGEILVMEEDTYRLEVEDTHGLKNLRPPWYTVQLQPDLAPTVRLRQPEDGLEVDHRTVLNVGYEAEDDFGLQDATLVYFGADAVEHRIVLRPGRFDHRRIVEKYLWDMYQQPLPEGDTVQFYIEVYDNDTISGPKKGVSQTLTLKMRNRKQEHQELERLQEEVADALLDLLADHLDLADQFATWGEQSADTEAPSQNDLEQAQELHQQAMERAEQIAAQLREAFAGVQQDPYSTYETYADLQALQRNMARLQDTLMPQLQQEMQQLASPPGSPAPMEQASQTLEQVIQELERLASFAEDIANAEKIHDLMNASIKMMEQQNQLLAALDNLPRDFQGGEIPPELQQMLDALNDLMQELANAIAQLPQSLPDEFLNRQLDMLPLADMMQQLEQIRQKLAQGDIEGAKQLAAQLLKTLSTMVGSMQRMLQQARGGAMDTMAQQLQESSDALEKLIQRQETIVQGTQQLDQAAVQQLNQAQRRALETTRTYIERELSMLSKLAWELSRQARQHPELSGTFQRAQQQLLQRLQALRKNFAAHDLPQALKDLEAAQRQLAWMQRRAAGLEPADEAMQQHASQAIERLQGVRRKIDALPQNRQAMLTPGQRGQLEGLGQRQGAVRQDTEALHQTFQ
ncbi:MAG: DUF4175 family protein, partial [Candidatus Tectomicrobia bacterium]